jgi:hypothetical protein
MQRTCIDVPYQPLTPDDGSLLYAGWGVWTESGFSLGLGHQVPSCHLGASRDPQRLVTVMTPNCIDTETDILLDAPNKQF